MRYLAYLVVILILLTAGLMICSLLLPDQRTPAEEQQPLSASAPETNVPESAMPPPETIKVEGDGLSPEVKQVLAAGFKKLLGEAFARAVNKTVEEVFQKLRIADDVERKLLAARLDWGGPDEDPDGPIVWAFHLVRPANADQAPETIEVTSDGRMTIRFTRASAAVDQPLAITTLTYLVGTRLVQRELFLAYGPDGEWRAIRPNQKSERLGSDK